MPAARTPLFHPATAVALLAGVCAALALPDAPTWPLAVTLALAGLALGWRDRRWRLAGTVLLGAGIASLHAADSLARRLPAEPATLSTVVTGRIADLPRAEARRTVFPFDIEEERSGQLAGQRIRLAWHARGKGDVPELHAGERWTFAVRLRSPRGLRNPGGWDAEKGALVDRLAATGTVRATGARRLSPGSGIAGWRDATAARIGTAVARPSSRFVRALALGDTRGLSDEDWSTLRANGLTHLIAISGFHVGMVAGAGALVARLFWWLWPGLGRRLPARLAAAGAGAGCALVYAAAAGFSLPTVRTLLMIAVVAGAQALRRSVGTTQTLAVAAMLVLVADPLSVLTPGFWLSFLGVAWLLWCLPRGTGSWFAELVKAQGVATLGLLPVTVLLFGQASLAGPVANLVAVPWWSLVVAPLSVGGLVLEWIHPAAGAAAWRLAAWCFDLPWPMFEWLADSPVALWWLPQAHWLAAPLAMCGAFWLLLPRPVPGRWLALLLWPGLLWPATDAPGAGEASVTVVDVGQGLAVLVRTRHHAVLYDAGPAVPEGYDAGERVVLPAARALGVRHIDRVIVSHGDLDHAGGLAAIRRELPVADLLAPDGSGVPGADPCLAGRSWAWDGVRFRFLHPPAYFPYLGNEASCVLRVETAGGSVLLTGDIGAIIERRLVREDPAGVQANVVVVAHHGSRHSSDPAFVAATGAQHAVFSAGHANPFRHPASDVVERWRAAGARPWATSSGGALTFRLAASGITVSPYREAHRRLWRAAEPTAAGAAGLSYRDD